MSLLKSKSMCPIQGVYWSHCQCIRCYGVWWSHYSCTRFPLQLAWFSQSETRSFAYRRSACETGYTSPCCSAYQAPSNSIMYYVARSCQYTSNISSTGFFRVESYQWRQHWQSSVRLLALQGQRWDCRPGVIIPWQAVVESLICNFFLSVAARTIVWADPSLRCTSMLLGR